MKSIIGLLALLILLLLGLGIGMSNTTPIALSFMGYQTPSLPFFVWMLLAVGLGAMISGTLAWFRQARLRREIKRLNKALSKR